MIIANVGDHLVAYVCLFGHWRFSALLGPKSSLSTRGLALNPRSTKLARFILEAEAPLTYVPRVNTSYKKEQESIRTGVQEAFSRTVQKWKSEALSEYAENLTSELMQDIAEAGLNVANREAAIEMFARKLAALTNGENWEIELDEIFDEDSS